MADHTPTPWHTRQVTGHTVICSGLRQIGIARLSTNELGEANAAFIVRACNAHDELVASLSKMLDVYWGVGDGNKPPEFIAAAYVALKKATAP